MKAAGEGKIPVQRETVAGLPERWLEHIETRGRAPKTLLENRRMATIVAEELGTKRLVDCEGGTSMRSTTNYEVGVSPRPASADTTGLTL